jgi:hypothetical protein
MVAARPAGRLVPDSCPQIAHGSQVVAELIETECIRRHRCVTMTPTTKHEYLNAIVNTCPNDHEALS